MTKEKIIEILEGAKDWNGDVPFEIAVKAINKMAENIPPEQTRVFVELVVKYPDPELCTYKEYKGKPYYSIKYIENGETYVGYGTYNPEVLSQYLKEYFISSAQPDLQPTCNQLATDCISRQAAIDAFLTELTKRERKNLLHTWSTVEVKYFVTEMLEQLPSSYPDLSSYSDKLWRNAYERGKAEAEPHWVPCNERLPEKYGKYLVTFVPSGGTFWTCVLVAHYSDLMGISKPSFHVGNPGKNDFQNITEQVTAWMPLPKPYRKENR